MEDNLTISQKKAIQAAKWRMAEYSWFKGQVCMDNLPSDEECKKDFNGAVLEICIETAFWEK
jgi:hypothetical protein